MSKFSKEELRKKLQKEKTGKGKRKIHKEKTEDRIDQSSSKNENLSQDLKRLGLISLVVILLLIISIYIKNQTDIFTQIADYFYQLIN